MHHLEIILRAVGAHRAYRHYFKDRYRETQVAEFVVLCQEMPRSLRFCSDCTMEVLTFLTKLTGSGLASLAIANAIHTTLTTATMETIFTAGLHEFLNDFLTRNATLATTTAIDFNFG